MTFHTDNYLSSDIFINSLLKTLFVYCTINMLAIEIKISSLQFSRSHPQAYNGSREPWANPEFRKSQHISMVDK